MTDNPGTPRPPPVYPVHTQQWLTAYPRSANGHILADQVLRTPTYRATNVFQSRDF